MDLWINYWGLWINAVEPLSATLCKTEISEKASKKGRCPDFHWVFAHEQKRSKKGVGSKKKLSHENKEKTLRGLYALPADIFSRFAYVLIFAIFGEFSRKVLEASHCIPEL